MPIQFLQQAGSVYVRFDDGTVVDATAGTGVDAGTYSVADSALATAGLTAGKRSWRALLGTAAGASASDTALGVSGDLFWDATGAAEVVPPTQASVNGVPGLVQDQLIGSGVTVGTIGTWDPDTALGALSADTSRLTPARAAKIDRIQDSGTVATSTEASSGGSGGTVIPASIRPIASSNWIKLGSRADGTLANRSPLRMTPGERRTFGVKLGPRAARADPVDGFALPTTSDATVVSPLDNPSGEDGRYWGVRADGVAFTLEAADDATEGETATVTLAITTEGDDIERPSFTVEIVGP